MTFIPSPTQTQGPGTHVSVRVFNSAGEEVALLVDSMALSRKPSGLSAQQPSFMPDDLGQGVVSLDGTSVLLIWQGENTGGQKVSSGVYYVTAAYTDSFGSVETYTVALTVIRSGSPLVIEVFNSAGELVWTQSKSTASATGLRLSEEAFTSTDSGSGVKIIYGSASSDQVLWDGKNMRGEAVAGGTYTVQITQGAAGAAKRSYSASVTVLATTEPVYGSAVLSANPLRGAATLEITLTEASPGLKAEGRVYNLAGELVGQLEGNSPVLRWKPAGGAASGIYIIELRVRNAQGQGKQAVLKLAVIR